MNRIQMLGLCRFSYPTGGDGFSEVPGDLDANIARLYDPARLAQRFWFFETLCLPLLAAQTDPDFQILLIHGAALPQPWRDRLRAAVAPLPQIRLSAQPEGLPHRETCNRLMRAARDPEARAVGEFTMDDDDGVAPDFIARARADFDLLRPLWRQGKRLALDYNSGLAIRAPKGGAGRGDLKVAPVQADFWAPGLVIFSGPRSTRSIQDFNHRRVWSRIPSVTLPQPPMFLRGSHDSNDSRVDKRLAASRRGDGVEGPEILADRFGLDAATLQDSWRAFARTSPPAG